MDENQTGTDHDPLPTVAFGPRAADYAISQVHVRYMSGTCQ